jgi:hypothetical protein
MSSILLLPKISKPFGGQLGVSCRVLDVAMAEPLLDGSRVVSIVGQLKAAGVAQHVRVDREGELDATDQLSLAAREARRLR